ncbi:MAG: MFS transporter [Elusimicrobiota bacterium]
MKDEGRRNVIGMGAVSFFADVAGEMIAPILPLYLTVTLGAPPIAVGLVDGSAELAASLFRAVGGWWSDRAGRRKPTVVLGYSLSALAKPALALTASWPGVLFVRFLDRTGKGLRGTARDALIASSVEKESWGRAFGLHRAMDTAGAVAGPLIGLWLMEGRGFSHRGVFVAATVPAVLSILVLFVFVRETRGGEPAAAPEPRPAAPRPPLTPEFWRFLAIYGLFAVGNSSDSFLLLKAKASGLAEGQVILAYVLFNLVNAGLAPSIGARADRVGRRRTVAAGFAVFALCYAGFAVAGPAALWPLFALYGLHAALVEGSFRAVVSQFSDEAGRGTAHGVFQSAAGVLAFTASVLAGALWTRIGPAAPFWFGAICAALSSAALFSAVPSAPRRRA